LKTAGSFVWGDTFLGTLGDEVGGVGILSLNGIDGGGILGCALDPLLDLLLNGEGSLLLVLLPDGEGFLLLVSCTRPVRALLILGFPRPVAVLGFLGEGLLVGRLPRPFAGAVGLGRVAGAADWGRAVVAVFRAPPVVVGFFSVFLVDFLGAGSASKKFFFALSADSLVMLYVSTFFVARGK
jgi:hypothetical protein